MSILIPSTISGGTSVIPRTTVAFGTPITAVFPTAPGMLGMKFKIAQVSWENAGTVNNLFLMPALTRVKVAADVAAGATSIILTKDPGSYSTIFPATRPPMAANNLIAASDYIAYRTPGGIWVQARPSAVSTDPTTGRVTVTVTAVGNQGIKAGADVVFFGVSTDTSPNTGLAAPQLLGVASTVTNYGGDGRILAQNDLTDAPMMVWSANATATCVLHGATGYVAP